MKNKVILWIAAALIAGCTIVSQLPEYDEMWQQIALGVGSLLTVIFAGSALPVFPPEAQEAMVKFLKVLPSIIIKIAGLFKKKETGMKWMFLLIIPMLMLSSCTANFYDKGLREEVIENKAKIVDSAMVFAKDAEGNYLFSVNYIAGFYRLALLGEGKLSEDDVVKAIEAYKAEIREMRGE